VTKVHRTEPWDWPEPRRRRRRPPRPPSIIYYDENKETARRTSWLDKLADAVFRLGVGVFKFAIGVVLGVVLICSLFLLWAIMVAAF
jgi:hypothetical protein